MDHKIRTRILEQARRDFYRLGYSKVTMDDLSAELGMSKKTLYKYFPRKKELLKKVVARFKVEMSDGVDEILLDESLDFPEKLHRMLSFVGSVLSDIGPYFLDDLRKNAPFVWEELQEYKRDAAYQRFNKLLEEGARMGYVKADVNKTMAVMLYAGAIESLINPRLTDEMPERLLADLPHQPTAIFEGMIRIMLEGILEE